MKLSNVLVSLALVAGASAPVAAQEWAHWRGPHYDGSTVGEDLPVEFGKKEGVRWSADLPGPGASTPIILGDRVFLSTVDSERDSLRALCFDRESGKELWDRPGGSGWRPEGVGSATRSGPRSNYASPSPVADADGVVFFYGNGDLTALTPQGEQRWTRNLQKDHGAFTFQWTFSASPTLFDGRLYLQILQRNTAVQGRGKDGNPSFLLALDPATGETLYKHLRPSAARKESLESYATPIPYTGSEGRSELLVVGGDVITGHEPATGVELWRWGEWNAGHREEWWRVVPSAVVGSGMVLVCAPKRAPVYAIPLGGEGTLEAEALAWKSEGRRNLVSSDVPTPLYYRGRFFVLSDVRESLSRVHPMTGKIEWSLAMPGRHLWRASPTGADGKIYCINHGGEVVVVDAESGEVLARNPMGEEDDDQIRSTVAVAHGNLFVRTNTTLYCVGK